MRLPSKAALELKDLGKKLVNPDGNHEPGDDGRAVCALREVAFSSDVLVVSVVKTRVSARLLNRSTIGFQTNSEIGSLVSISSQRIQTGLPNRHALLRGGGVR